MDIMNGKGAALTGAASGIDKGHTTVWFLQYPVMRP